MKHYFILIILSLSLIKYPSKVKADEIKQATSEQEHEKLRFELISQLLENSHISLSGKKSCESFVTNKQGTVGLFIAWGLSFYNRGVDNSIEAVCENKNEICYVNFHADSKGESPWSCGLRFKYKKKKIIRSSIECIGSC